MDSVLVYCPLSSREPEIHHRTLASITALEWDGLMEFVCGRDGTTALPGSLEGNRNITKKYNEARRMALDNDFDALFTIESDMIIPSNSLLRLSQVDADVAYGLYVSRHGKHPWLAFERVTPEVRGSRSFGDTQEQRRALWGKVVETAGVGMGCTWIWRNVLEDIEFRVEDEYIANDWYFSLDLQRNGYTQKHDCGLICGHIDGYATYWPDIASGYRVEETNKLNLEELIDMAKGKYVVLRTLSFGSDFAYPGAEVELDDETAKILLRKRAIKPVEQAKPKEVKDYDSND
jgi:hypothetical protein